MSLLTLQETLDFLGLQEGYFTVNASNDVLRMSYDGGAVTNCDIADGTYDGDGLATAIKTAIDSALSCTSTVTYSSTTRKFTIAVGAGHTLAYTNTGSDAASLVGFDQDHSAALSLTSDNAAGDPVATVETIKDGVEKWVSNYCSRIFESTNRAELYDGTGTPDLYLDHYPIISLNRLSLGRLNAISVKNTATCEHASVSVSSTAVSLYKDGTTSTLALATYTTMTTLVDAINAISGWTAALESTTYASYPSSSLIIAFGKQCSDSREVQLEIPQEAEDEFEVYPNEGRIRLPYNFWEGSQNVYVNYTAGYATIPEDLKLAVNILIKNIYQRRSEESFGLTSFSLSGISQSFEQNGIPEKARDILDLTYKKLFVASF